MSVLGESWYPIRIFRDDGAWWVDWCRFDELAFSEPLYRQTVERALERPFNRALHRITPIETLGEVASDARERDATLAPDGFLFHLSRSGATLVSRAFAALDTCIALSQAEPIDEILRATRDDAKVDDPWRIARLRELVAVFGRRRFGERRYIVTLHAWHVYDLDLIERAFPAVPWAYIARDPIEVVVSHATQPGRTMSAANAPTLLGLSPEDAMQLPQAERFARALGRMLEELLQHQSTFGIAIDYRDLPQAIVERIAPHFALALDDDDRARIARAVERFGQTLAQRAAADLETRPTEELRAAAERYAIDAYRRWNERRRETPRVAT